MGSVWLQLSSIEVNVSCNTTHNLYTGVALLLEESGHVFFNR